MDYIFYFYSKASDTESSLIKEEVTFENKLDALFYAADYIAEKTDVEVSFSEEDELVNYLDEVDIDESDTICVAIKSGDEFIYGDDELLKYFISGSDDDKITEAIESFPKITKLADVRSQIKALSAELKTIENDTHELYSWESQEAVKFLTDEEQKKYKEVSKHIEELHDEINDIETQYTKIEDRWITGTDGEAERDFDIVITDRELQKEFAPKINELQKTLGELRVTISELEHKMKAAYDADAQSRRAAAGFAAKKKSLDDLAVSEANLMQEILDDPDFVEVVSYIREQYKDIRLSEANIVNGNAQITLIIKSTLEPDSDDFDIDEDNSSRYMKGYLNSNITDRFFDEVVENLEQDDFECVDSDSIFKIEVPDYPELISESELDVTYYPGVHTLPNGDPGYPDDWDEEINGDTIAEIPVIVTKLK